MSDTPETDKAAFVADCWQSHVPVKFAENLERERDDLRDIFPKVLEALESGACASTCSVDFLREIPREVKLVRQRLERERDEAIQARKVSAADWLNQIANADLRLTRIKRERDEAASACHIWQQGHSAIVADRDDLLNTIRVLHDDADVIVADRDYWRAEAERWRDFHRDMVDDRDALIETLADIDSSAYKCDEPWETIERVSVITANLLNGRNPP